MASSGHSATRRELMLALAGAFALRGMDAQADALTRAGVASDAARGVIDVTIVGNRVIAKIDLLVLGVELILDFEQPLNLTAPNLGIGAALVDPLDPAFLARLPDPDLLSVPLPLMISVEPPADGGLAFSNAVGVELHTHLLAFELNSPFRLYKAPAGGVFHDITSDVLPGSVRTRGHTGGFSDFLILTDLFPAYAEEAADKYLFLDTRVATGAISAKARGVLQSDLAASRTAFDAGNYASARSALSTFVVHVKSFAGFDVPNRWRSARDLDNVAGDLLGEAGSLDFSLRRLGG